MSKKNSKTRRPRVGGSALSAVLALVAGLSAATALAQPAASLERELTNAGWSAQREADGSLTLRPPVPSQGETETGAEPAAHTPESETLKGRLRSLGWGVEQESDGTLVLHPPSVPVAPEQGQEEAAAAGQASTPEAEPEAAEGRLPTSELANALRARNWQVDSLDDGSLIIRQPSTSESATREFAFDPGCGPWSAPAVANGDVQLPVDQWGEAHRIASQWLEELAPEGLQVGRIRQVPRLYVVSIVSDRKPFVLEHQVVIRKRDGKALFIH